MDNSFFPNLMDQVMHLKVHHLICLKNFDGRGYNDIHRQRMFDVKNSLKSNPFVFIVEDYDTICTSCPALKKGACNPESVAQLDNAFINLLGLDYSTGYDYEELLQKINSLTTEDCKKACKGCGWFDICYKP